MRRFYPSSCTDVTKERTFAEVRQRECLSARLAEDGLEKDLGGGAGLQAGRSRDGLGANYRGQDEVAAAVCGGLREMTKT